jgi:ATP-dependent DNA helicase RecG
MVQDPDHRKYMVMAVSQMEQTVHEPRLDGKATPLVGAVLVKSDGSVDTAHRGELREGDHAEFTLLERKNRCNKLDGSVLLCDTRTLRARLSQTSCPQGQSR